MKSEKTTLQFAAIPISINWIVSIAGGILIAIQSRRKLKSLQQNS